MPNIEYRKILLQKATLDDGIKLTKKYLVRNSNDFEIFES
jgi:hypothetical protein